MKARLSLWGILFFFISLLFVVRTAWGTPIHVGTISEEAVAEMRKFLPFAAYLAKELGSQGIDQGKVVIAKNIPQMAAFMKQGKVDLFIDSPFPSLAVGRLSGSRFLLRRWKKGIGEYHTVIFAKQDTNFNQLDDLKGKMIAFEEPFSSSGYMLPKMVLLQRGYKLAPKSDASEPVAAGEIGYLFSRADENTMMWVLMGKVAAGTMDNKNYKEEARASLNSLKIIDKTFSIPRQIVSYRADLPTKLVDRIKEILMKMDQSEAGKKTLQQFEKTTKFDELTDQVMGPLLKTGKFIDAELGIK